MTQATTTTGAIEMMSVFMMQERAPSQEEAEKMLNEAKKGRKGWLGGRVVPPGRSQKGRFRLIQAFFEDDGGEVPVMSQYYMRLHAIDFELTREFFPINEAIKRAIEVILHYYAYQEK